MPYEALLENRENNEEIESINSLISFFSSDLKDFFCSKRNQLL